MPEMESPGAGEAYIPVPVETICQDSEPKFNLYMRNRANGYVLFLAKNTPVLRENLDRFLERGRRILYIECTDQSMYRDYVADHLDEVLSDPLTPRDRKASIVYDSASHLMNSVLDAPENTENLRRASEVARHTAAFVASADSVESILSMTNFDYTTHTHSVNVCVYGLSLARFLGMVDEQTMRDLGAGLLLHDVGKAKIRSEVLNKPGKLTAEEFEHMKDHTKLGETILGEKKVVPETAVIIAGQHHEKVDGSGYPRGLTGKNIHDFARMTSIIDMFDALTTRRSYKEPMKSFDALRIMKNDAGHLDEKMLHAFVRMLATGSKF